MNRPANLARARNASEVQQRRLYLRTLGASELLRESPDGTREPVLEASKLLALVASLAFSPGRTTTRDGLIDLLWSDLDPDAAKHALRQHLWQLKQRVGADLVVDGRNQLTLRSPIHSDRDDFLLAAEASDFERAVELYTGDFFPGFAAAGSSEFDRWAAGERTRLRLTFVRCAEVLTKQHLDAGRFRDAVMLAQRIRDEEPLRQHGWRLLLEALLARNDSFNATLEADALERLFVEEGLEPEPATRHLLAAVRRAQAGRDEHDDTPALHIELVGREREFATLMRAWERAAQGRRTYVHLTAPAGLGKTRLLAELQSRLTSMRARCVSVRANAGGASIPYALAGDLAEALAPLPGARGVPPEAMRALVALNPALSSVLNAPPLTPIDLDTARHRLIALRELISAVADERPLAILIDDLHWSDAASRALLSGLLGALSDHLPALICIAERPENASGPLAPAFASLTLEPLSLSALTSLVTGVASLAAGRWSETFLSELLEGSGGVPLYIVETLRLGLLQELLSIRDGAWRSEKPTELRDMLRSGGVLRERIKELHPYELSLLEVLAVAGTPLDETALHKMRATGEPPVALTILGLQNKGLVRRAGAAVMAMHDEISALVLRMADEKRRRELHYALGSLLMGASGDDHRNARVATAHFRAAGADREVHKLYASFVRHEQRMGNRQTHAGLAAELIGETLTASETARLVRSLPISVRLGLITRGRIASAIVGSVLVSLGVGAGILAMRKPAPPPPDAILAVMIQDDSGASVFETRVDTAGWMPDSDIYVNARQKPQWRYRGSARMRALYPRPGHPGSWVGEAAVSDSGSLELFLLSPNGGQERLTFSPGVDLDATWSPDGQQLAFATGRWSDLQHYDLAILDLTSRRVTRLTSGDPTDWQPRWSPDGTRIAFIRTYFDGKPFDLCVVAINGNRLRCHATNVQYPRLPGWLDDGSVLFADSSHLYRIDVNTWTSSKDPTVFHDFGLSPNGRWLACDCDTTDASHWWVQSVSASSKRRRVVIDGARRLAQPPQIAWALPPGRRRYLDRVDLDAGPGQPRVGVAHRLQVRGVDTFGARTSPGGEAFFYSTDTSVAVVDSLGVVYPKRAGTVLISVSAGGWRNVERRLTVEANRVDTLLRETWTRGVGADWVPFGIPTPDVDTGPGRTPGLNNRGDGIFSSGVHSARSWSARNGLAVDAMISTPTTLPQWQTQIILFAFGLDSVPLAAWDHRTGEMPVSQIGVCAWRYPGGSEGPPFSQWIRLDGGTSGLSLSAAGRLRSGGWYRVRIQVFPDGRCGFALNGTPLYIIRSAAPAQSAHLFLTGQSVRTKVLVGPLTLFSGVPSDIDWERLARNSRPNGDPKGAATSRARMTKRQR